MSDRPSCADLDPDEADRVFFDKKLEPVAVGICRGCPVRASCLAEALEAEANDPATYRHGVYGAKRPLERARLAGASTYQYVDHRTAKR